MSAKHQIGREPALYWTNCHKLEKKKKEKRADVFQVFVNGIWFMSLLAVSLLSSSKFWRYYCDISE